MGTTEMRQALHEFINEADERVLRLIYGMMKADADNDYELSDAHKQILDERWLHTKPHLAKARRGS